MAFEKCSICLEEMDDACVKEETVCKYEFHCKCLEKWLEEEWTCPMCRCIIVTYRTRYNKKMAFERILLHDLLILLNITFLIIFVVCILPFFRFSDFRDFFTMEINE